MKDRSTEEIRFPRIWLFAGICALVALTIVTVRAAEERGWGGYLRLIRNGSGCEATITRTDLNGACLTEYSYNIEGVGYLGAGSQCDAKVGQKVTVTYLVTDPVQSCIGDPSERLAQDVVQFYFGRLFFPPLM